jgi:hypothetical protein
VNRIAIYEKNIRDGVEITHASRYLNYYLKGGGGGEGVIPAKKINRTIVRLNDASLFIWMPLMI